MDYHSRLPLATVWGGGEVASADGLRFVMHMRMINAGPNGNYFGVVQQDERHLRVLRQLGAGGPDGKQLRVEFTRVQYDIERAARAIEESELPHEYATMLRIGKGLEIIRWGSISLSTYLYHLRWAYVARPGKA